MLSETSLAGKALVKALHRKARGGYSIDVVERATTEFPREALAKQVTQWELNGLVEVKASQVRAVS